MIMNSKISRNFVRYLTRQTPSDGVQEKLLVLTRAKRMVLYKTLLR